MKNWNTTAHIYEKTVLCKCITIT